MNDLNLLLRAVIENHNEDTPRLMYADVIEERGEPGDAERAELIRVQVLKTVGEDGRDVWNKAVESKVAFDWFPKGDIYLSNTDSSPRIWLSAEPGKGTFLERGFLPEITCDAATFLRHVDALIWHPEQTVENGKCSCSMYGRDGWVFGLKTWEQCQTCKGTGKRYVPRPCPPTAQPIRRVVLMTLNDEMRLEAVSNRTGNVYKLCRWPGVEFVLLRTGNVEEPDPYDPMVTA